MALLESHVCIIEGTNELIWVHVGHGIYTPKDSYLVIQASLTPLVLIDWWKLIWKLKAPPRTRLLMWNILMNKTPTRSNLMNRSYHGPSRCVLYNQVEELNDHLFLLWSSVIDLCNQVLKKLAINTQWVGTHIVDAWNHWRLGTTNKKQLCIPLIICWSL